MIKEFLKKNGPLLLTIASCAGVIGTAIFAHLDTKKAQKKIVEKKPETKKEEAKLTWKCYWRTALAGGATLASIIFTEKMNSKLLIGAVGTGVAARELLTEMQDQIRETYGDKGLAEIREKIAEKHIEGIEQAEQPNIYSYGLVSSKDDPAEDGDVLFYDTYTKRWFRSSLYAVSNGRYHLNRNFSLGKFSTFEDLYSFWGLDTSDKRYEWYKHTGWGYGTMEDGIYWIDISITQAEDWEEVGEKYYVIAYEYPPGNEEDET